MSSALSRAVGEGLGSRSGRSLSSLTLRNRTGAEGRCYFQEEEEECTPRSNRTAEGRVEGREDGSPAGGFENATA